MGRRDGDEWGKRTSDVEHIWNVFARFKGVTAYRSDPLATVYVPDVLSERHDFGRH